MPTQPYKNRAGKRIPGTTTIIGRFKDSSALLAWANKEGLEGRPIRGEGSVSQTACDAGTLAHLLVECQVKQNDWPDKKNYTDEVWDKAMSAYDAYKSWSAQTKMQICESEISLTCECHQFGGTLDAMLVQDMLSLGDIKTSNAVYSDYLIQLAAYGHLWEVNFPDRPITGGYHILRFSKAGGSFSHHYYKDLSAAWALFELYRKAYDLDKTVKEIL